MCLMIDMFGYRENVSKERRMEIRTQISSCFYCKKRGKRTDDLN